jgi:hypothetical protein
MTDAIDRLLDSLEAMIDAQDDMWDEEKYANYRQLHQIKEERYLPAKQAAREALVQAIKNVVQEEIRRSPKQKSWGLW